MDKDDEDNLELTVGYDPNANMVRIGFSKMVTSLAMRPQEAINLGQTLVRHGQRNIIPNKIIRPS